MKLQTLGDLIISEIKPVRSKYLSKIKHLEGDKLAYATAKGIQKAYENHLPLTTTCRTIGRYILQLISENMSEEQRAITETNIGFAMLKVLKNQGMLDWKQDKTNHNEAMKLVWRDEEKVLLMTMLVNLEEPRIRIADDPQFEKPQPRTKFHDPVAGPLVRRVNSRAIPLFTRKQCPLLYSAVNEARNTAFKVHRSLLELVSSCQEDELFSRKNKLITDEQRASIRRSELATIEHAEKIGDRTFYSEVFLDFRLRFYWSIINGPNPGGSELDKALLLFAEGEKIDYDACAQAIAGYVGYDKNDVDDRIRIGKRYIKAWMGLDLSEDKRWQSYDAPLLFAALMLELQKAGGDENYILSVPLQLDASTSGLQQLAALSRDEVSAKYCNIIESELRGDSYLAVADYIWNSIEEPNEADRGSWEALESTISELRLKYLRTSSKAAKTALNAFLSDNKEEIKRLSPVFWYKYKDKRRSLCKRNVMVRTYMAQERCMADNLIEDFSADIMALNKYNAFWLACKIYNACSKVFPKAIALMDQLTKLGLKAYSNGEDFGYVSVYHGAPMVQNYRKNRMKRVKVIDIDGSDVKLDVVVGKDEKLDYSKFRTSTAVNVIHNFDSLQVAMFYNNKNFVGYCIHDAMLSNSGSYFDNRELLRNNFIELYTPDRYKELCESLDAMDVYEDTEFGDWTPEGVENNLYCFD